MLFFVKLLVAIDTLQLVFAVVLPTPPGHQHHSRAPSVRQPRIHQDTFVAEDGRPLSFVAHHDPSIASYYRALVAQERGAFKAGMFQVGSSEAGQGHSQYPGHVRAQLFPSYEHTGYSPAPSNKRFNVGVSDREVETEEMKREMRIFANNILKTKHPDRTERSQLRNYSFKLRSLLSQEEKDIVYFGDNNLKEILKSRVLNGTTANAKRPKARVWYNVLGLNDQERDRVLHWIEYQRVGLPPLKADSLRRKLLNIPQEQVDQIKNDPKWDQKHAGPGLFEQVTHHLLDSPPSTPTDPPSSSGLGILDTSALVAQQNQIQLNLDKAIGKAVNRKRPTGEERIKLAIFSELVDKARGVSMLNKKSAIYNRRYNAIKALSDEERNIVLHGTPEQVESVVLDLTSRQNRAPWSRGLPQSTARILERLFKQIMMPKASRRQYNMYLREIPKLSKEEIDSVLVLATQDDADHQEKARLRFAQLLRIPLSAIRQSW